MSSKPLFCVDIFLTLLILSPMQKKNKLIAFFANRAAISKGCLFVCSTGEIEMKQLYIATRNFLCEEDGVTMIEYSLIAGLISVAAVALLSPIGDAVLAVFTTISTALTPTP